MVVKKKSEIKKPFTSAEKFARKNPRLFSTAKKIDAFLDLAPGKRIAVIADNDADGITSAVGLKLYLDSQGVESMVFFYDHYSQNFSYPLQSFSQFSPEKTIFLDLCDGFVSEVIEKLKNTTGPFLVIDHHQREVIRGNAFKSIVIKPGSFSEVEPSKYPVSKMVFDLFGGRDWVCAIGVIGDFAFEEWKDFIQKTEKKYKLTKKSIFSLAEIVECVTSQYSEKINSLFNFLVDAKSPTQLRSSEYIALKRLFDARLKILKEAFYKEAEFFDDTQVCFFKCDNRFSSKLSTIVSQEVSNKTVIIFEQPGNLIKCSIRRQDFRVNCGLLAKAGVAGIPGGNGGGHIPAAGAHFSPQYFEQFKKNVRRYMLQNPPKEMLKP